MAADIDYDSGAGLVSDREAAGWHVVIAPAIVIAAVLFNPLLAFINGNVRPLTSAPVIAC